MKYFGIIDKDNYKGYSNSLLSLMEDIVGEKIIYDINCYIDRAGAIGDIIYSAKQEKVTVISVANLGIDFFKSLNMNNVEPILISDRYYDWNMENIKEISLIMPSEAIEQYRKNNKNVYIKGYPADLVASPTKEEMLKRAEDYKKLNPEIAKTIETIMKDGANAFFIGGRVALQDGSWKENTPEIFEKAADMVLQSGKDAVVVFHGLRSFTNGKKENDFAPVNAFEKKIKENLKNNQKVVLLSKEISKNIQRKSVVKIFEKYDMIHREFEERINESNFGAAEYYFLLNEAVKSGQKLVATVEQMNFIPEALTLGASPNRFAPYAWELKVDNNEKTYEKLIKEYKKNGKILLTQKQAFNKMLGEQNSNDIVNLISKNYQR